MPNTALGFPYPSLSDAPNGPAAIEALAAAVDDLLNGEWEAFTTSWTASTTPPTLGNGMIEAVYKRVGKRVDFRIHLTAGSTTNFGAGTWQFTLPAIATSGRWLFPGVLRTAADYPIWGLVEGGTDALSLRRNPATAGGAFTAAAQGDPATASTGHRIFVSGTYETP